MGNRSVVVVEDEAAIAMAIATRLEQEGFRVATAGDGPTGVATCLRLEPDLVILDLMLPGFDGLEVCKRIQEDRAVPVLMLTARDAEKDVLIGLGVGADDYMTKPFSMRELVARVHAVLRRVERSSDRAAGPIEIGEVRIDPVSRRVKRNGETVHLTATEFDLLHHLAVHSGAVFTRTQLLQEVWGFAGDAGQRTVDSHVRALRRKLDAGVIRTVHGVGYALGGEE